MRLLLVQQFAAREPRTPIAVMDLAAYARQFGHHVDVGYADAIGSLDYDMIGWSAVGLTDDIRAGLRSLRERYSGRRMLGGKATDCLPDDQRQAFAAMGIELWDGPGERLFGEQPLGGQPMDYSAYPSWDAADFLALDRTHSMWEAMSSRGCPYHCHFCHNTERRISHFSPTRTIDNASIIYDAGRDRVFFVDDVFALRADKMMAILEEGDRRGVELRGATQFFIHVSLLRDDTLAAIDAFAPIEMQIGIESGDDRMLHEMGKTFTAQQAEECLQRLHAHGHRVACLFLMGFPGETKESLQATVEFVERNRHLMSGWWVSYYQPIPGTVGWDRAEARGNNAAHNSGWNTDISYLDPGLEESDLQQARAKVMV